MVVYTSKFDLEDTCYLRDDIPKNPNLKNCPLHIVDIIFAFDTQTRIKVRSAWSTDEKETYIFWESELYKKVLVLELTYVKAGEQTPVTQEYREMEDVLDRIRSIDKNINNNILSFTIQRVEKTV